jgi:hypothetical protein
MSKGGRQALVVMALAGACTGCFFRSPLDAVATVPIDAALLGTWRCLEFGAQSDSKPFNLTVARASDRQYSVVFQEDGESPGELSAYLSVVHGRTLVNIHVPDEDTKPWLIARYSVERSDMLYVELMEKDSLPGADTSPESFRRAVAKAGRRADLFRAYSACVRVQK